MLQFRKAEKKEGKLRLAFFGPSGSGKTFSSLTVARAMFPTAKIALIDSEHKSASKYADLFDFDVLELSTFSPDTYVEAIRSAEEAGYEVIIIDSLSHAWVGKDGALEQVNMAAKKTHGNSYAAWRDVTPMHNRLVDAMLACSSHLIVTCRSKTEYVVEKDEKTGKSVPRKIGLAPVQRDGLEYEFDIVGELNYDNDFIVSKTRCAVLGGKVISKPGKNLGDILKVWLEGIPVPPDVGKINRQAVVTLWETWKENTEKAGIDKAKATEMFDTAKKCVGADGVRPEDVGPDLLEKLAIALDDALSGYEPPTPETGKHK